MMSLKTFPGIIRPDSDGKRQGHTHDQDQDRDEHGDEIAVRLYSVPGQFQCSEQQERTIKFSRM